MPPVAENELLQLLGIAKEHDEEQMLELEACYRRIAELEAALEFYATGDPQNPADGFVARDVLKKLHSAKAPDAQPTEPEADG